MKSFLIPFFVIIGFLLSCCSTDLDVTGDYKETMVVYGLLDQSQGKQYIKVNKAFLGKGDALLFAKLRDSVQFANSLDVKLKRFSDGHEVNLLPDNSIPKKEGAFFSGDQSNVIYSFASTGSNALTINSEYVLSITHKETGNQVSAKTSLIQDFSFTKPTNGTTTSFIFTTPNLNTRLFVEWTSSKNARLYQLIVRLNYKDSTTNGTFNKQLDWIFPQHKTASLSGGEVFGNDFSRLEYLSFIGKNLSDYTGLIARKALNVHLLVVAGGEDLNTFIEVNKPSTGLVQERPIYTNISNGYGIFSSRYYKAPYILTLYAPAPGKELDSLACGRFTKKLKFLNALGNLPLCP